MDRFQGVRGIVAILGLVVLVSKHRSQIRWRILGAGFALQVATAVLVLLWEPGYQALQALSAAVSKLISYAEAGTNFVFGGLYNNDQIGFVFALGVLPVIIFIGALIGMLYYLRVIQWFIEIVGTAKTVDAFDDLRFKVVFVGGFHKFVFNQFHGDGIAERVDMISCGADGAPSGVLFR